MRGLIFTEFLEMVEQQFSLDVTDRILEESDLNSGGAYTTVGNYDHGEILRLVSALSRATGVPIPDLVRAFGRHLFGRLAASHAAILHDIRSSFELLERLESHVHREVRKIYADAELPKFTPRRLSETEMELEYVSSRPFADLAEGLIEGCVEYYGQQASIERRDLPSEQGSRTNFRLRLTG